MKARDEKKYLEKKLAINKQLALILSSNQNFQNSVSAIRTQFDIPAEGVPIGEPITKWKQEFWRKSEQWQNQNWPSWRVKIASLEKAGRISDVNKLNKEFNQNVPLNKFKRETKKLLVKCRLGLNWLDGVEAYVISNDINTLQPKTTVWVQTKTDEIDQLKEISIVVDKTTTWEDIRFMWPMVEELQENLLEKAPQRQKISKQLEHGLLALKLLKEKKSYKSIATQINKDFHLPEAERYDDTQIPDLLKNTRRKLGK